MRSNKVEYSTVAGLYFTTYDAKIHFCMPEFFSHKIILQRFCVENDSGELGIGYDRIIGQDLMLQLGLMAD